VLDEEIPPPYKKRGEIVKEGIGPFGEGIKHGIREGCE
jgi:hypothetical protein